MDEVKEFLANADLAFSNKQYSVALEWYQKALEVAPDDVYALSRAGAICVALEKFQDALIYFGRAKALDPDNGDNAFNYGNACFFNKDYAKAFEQYVEAEKLGCSEDVKPRLYYQMAMLCSIRRDVKSSLAYFRKCEESDKTGMTSLNPDLISEKLKLYLVQQNYAGAEKCAAQLVAINPTDFTSYMIYFSMLMASKNYSAAENLLKDAEQYADLSAENGFALTMQMAALQLVQENSEKAIQLLEERKAVGDLTNDQLSQLLLALAEAQAKGEHYDEAIRILHSMLSGQAYVQPRDTEGAEVVPILDLTPEELDQMAQQDMALIQEKINAGEIDADMGLYAAADYDEEGRLIHYYDELALIAEDRDAESAEENTSGDSDNYELSKELREKVIFTLLSCHLAKDEFAVAQKLASVLKHSENKYYNYFCIYTDAMAERKLHGATDTANRKYAEALAFFRSQTFSDPSDALACIFRARLYAEEGKYEKAAEIAQLLADDDQKTILAYIESCRH